MRKNDVMKLAKSVWKGVNKHSPQILTGIGVAGMWTAVVLTNQAATKAEKLINRKKQEKGTQLTVVETVQAGWKPYVPAVVTGVASTVCLIGSCSVSTRRTAALATAYKLSETALAEFKEKAIETVGEKKVKEIKERIVEDKLASDPVTNSEVMGTGRGNTLCYDTISGRYFTSDIESIRKAVNLVNRQLTYDMYISLTEFYGEIGLTSTKISDEIGWNLDDGLLEVDFTSKIADDGRPCLVMDYNIAPRYDFSRLY